jgi:hypothetical protein
MNVINTYFPTFVKAGTTLKNAFVSTVTYMHAQGSPLAVRGLVVVGLILLLVLLYPLVKFMSTMLALKVAIANGMV